MIYVIISIYALAGFTVASLTQAFIEVIGKNPLEHRKLVLLNIGIFWPLAGVYLLFSGGLFDMFRGE
ncbi:TMhelix containing protein [Vibrio phage 1.168.O._10N.261.52.A10]|nr:TMhelix containing protein [Vibrio phage 1.074.O._10N.222.49.B7]AUR92027.1 TMhelix containing protein [Vibrio phage 1.168.O._10N.261.52.A10]